jgi:tripartite-type tricarboxylate transporter receptor subunit TctC
MKLPRRNFLHLTAGAAALPAVSRSAWAQAYPSRPVRLIVPFAPGGASDITARLIGQWLSERLGQQFIIENRPGGGGNIGSEVVVRAPADGYTLLLCGTPNATNAALYDKLNFNFIRDIAPVAGIEREPHVMVVNPSVPAKTVPEFIAYAKANPGKLTMASGGIGTPSHVFGELFKMMAGVDMVHVPYRSAGPTLTDLLGGQAQIIFPTTVASIEYIRAGRLRALAVTTATRSETLPQIPTVSEFVPGFEATGWYGVGAPKNTPAEIIDRLNKEINAGLAYPKIKARLADLGGDVLALSPADFGRMIADETEKWRKPPTSSPTDAAGNLTGVLLFEVTVIGKWLAMLKEIAPSLVRAAFVGNPKTAPYYDYYLRAGTVAGHRACVHPRRECHRHRACHRVFRACAERRSGVFPQQHERGPS